MGTVALAAKITHVPSMYLSELPGKHHGCREAAIEGHRIIGQRCRDMGVDTIVVSDVHWLVNAGYHVNCNARFEGVYTSNELPHFINNMAYSYPGNPDLGRILGEGAAADALPRARGLAFSRRVLAPLAVAVVAVLGVLYWQQDSQQTSATRHADFADVDTEVLTGELPVVAYLDTGGTRTVPTDLVRHAAGAKGKEPDLRLLQHHHEPTAPR